MHNDFTLFQRGMPGGKKVFYYYAYDKAGERKGPWTTKCQHKTAARNYCHELLRNGNLLPDRGKALTFGEYAQGFWERGSEYVKNQESRGDITDTYIEASRNKLDVQIMPFFADTPLEKMNDKDINSWLLGFRERKVEKDGKTEVVRYQNTYANAVFGTLNIMLEEAVRRGLLANNPCSKVRRLKNDRKKMTILTDEEAKNMFPENYATVWGKKDIAYAANRLASLTGMRIGELLGLRGEYVFDNYICVCGQYGVKGYVPYTKTKEDREIPLMPEMIAVLRGLMKKNGKGFVFSQNGGANPVSKTYIRRELKSAMIKIGISAAEIKQRALTVHSWRHFLNTELLKQGMTVPQVQGVTGHKSVGMTEKYTHLEASQINGVIKAQSVIAGTAKPEKKKQPKKTEKAESPKEGAGYFKVVKTPYRKTA